MAEAAIEEAVKSKKKKLSFSTQKKKAPAMKAKVVAKKPKVSKAKKSAKVVALKQAAARETQGQLYKIVLRLPSYMGPALNRLKEHNKISSINAYIESLIDEDLPRVASL